MAVKTLRTSFILGAAALGLAACATQPEPTEEVADAVELTAISFDILPGWGEDAGLDQALLAFNRTCERIERRPDSRGMGGAGFAGTVGHWRPLCDEAATLPASGIEGWLEDHFQAYRVSNRDEAIGLFTGYYEPSFAASLTPSADYATPVHARPPELVMVDLGQFREEFKGRRIAGTVENGRLQPFADRADIAANGLEGEAEILVYAKDPVDVFFLQIQGSGRAILPDGSAVRLGYAAQNGHPYFAIGRALIERGILTRETVSLQTIRAWLQENPDEAQDVMNLNASYVFFRELTGPGPVGAANVALVPGRSLAVDRSFHAMGVPVWVSTSEPQPDGSIEPFNRLMIMQDTGGAIRGPVRGDIFYGAGEAAEFAAGHMKQAGTYFVLLPRSLSPTS